MARLLLVCEYSTLNGGERSMLATLDGVCRAGFSVAVVAPPTGPLAEALAARGVEVLPLSCRDGAGGRLSQGRLREELARQIARCRPDLLHANSLAMGRLAGPVAAESAVPSIAHLRDIVRLSTQAMADLNRHTRLLAVSKATRDFHVAAGLSPEKTRVLYNGVDLGLFCPRPGTGRLYRELGLPPEAMLVGTIGQIGLRKGQDVLVRAAVGLARSLPHVHYAIVGARHSDKAESRRFEAGLRAAAEGAMMGRLHLLGVRSDVDLLLAELTVLVHPARQEPLGRVLLEAAAAGVPVIATDVGGTREIFPPESDSARLVPPDDPEAMTGAIAGLLGDPALRARLSAAARRRAEDAFSLEAAVRGLVEHYRAVGR
jgi:glycosyltransferase involved in cell wall biosynthesis